MNPNLSQDDMIFLFLMVTLGMGFVLSLMVMLLKEIALPRTDYERIKDNHRRKQIIDKEDSGE